MRVRCGIHASRPLDESIASLKSRSRRSRNWLNISYEQCESVQHWLWERKHEFLGQVDHLDVEYADLLNDPDCQVERIIRYLNLDP